MTGRRRTQLTTAALLAAALGISFAATPAHAQVQVQSGDALDANQQVGSGGYNAASSQVDYRARNLLITGEVGGGRAFRDSVNYGSAGAFQGNLGSDSLFNFRRDSVYSAPGGVNLQAQSFGDRVIVTRPTTTIPGLQIDGGNALSTTTSYDPRAGVLTFRQSGGGLVAVTGLNDPTRLSATNNSLGLVRTPQGLVSIDASPLTGVRYNPLDVNTGLNNPNLRLPGLNQPLGEQPKPETDVEDEDDQPIDPNDPSLARKLRIDGRYNPARTDDATASLRLSEDPLAISLGTQVQSALALQVAGRDDNNIPNAQAQSIRQQLFGQAPQDPNQPPRPPQNPYEKLINDIIAQANDSQAEQAVTAEDEPTQWQGILETPEQAIVNAKRKARDTALRLSLGLVDENGNVDYETELPSIDPDSELGQLISDLSYNLPRVGTLVGDNESRLNTLMANAEEQLQAGQYLASENIYRQVLRETQGDPLAKAGLIHSQMGGGMIRSAAYNLRDLFSQHPELIALRYEAKLLPETDRLRWLQDRLQKMINDDNQGPDPGLVLAYLGYQLKAQPLVEFGLSVAEAEAPRDPLMPVLRRIWLGEEGAAGKGAADKEGK